MARIRMIKPEFFDDPDIAALSSFARLLFIGLWLQADREGRLAYDPRRIKARLFPYDDVSVDALNQEIINAGFMHIYTVKGKSFLQIRSFVKHQRPHPKEPQSVIPPPVEKHGEPWKKTDDPSESGVLILDSGTRNLGSKIRTAPTARSRPRLAVDNVKIITKLAHEVLKGHHGHKVSGADLCDEIKTLCAKRKIAYDATVIRKALDSAEVQRKAAR